MIVCGLAHTGLSWGKKMWIGPPGPAGACSDGAGAVIKCTLFIGHWEADGEGEQLLHIAAAAKTQRERVSNQQIPVFPCMQWGEN